jgi:hypothetical protein
VKQPEIEAERGAGNVRLNLVIKNIINGVLGDGAWIAG